MKSIWSNKAGFDNFLISSWVISMLLLFTFFFSSCLNRLYVYASYDFLLPHHWFSVASFHLRRKSFVFSLARHRQRPKPCQWVAWWREMAPGCVRIWVNVWVSHSGCISTSVVFLNPPQPWAGRWMYECM